MSNFLSKTVFLILFIIFCCLIIPLVEIKEFIGAHITYDLYFLKDNSLVLFIAQIYNTYYLAFPFAIIFILSGIYMFKDTISRLAWQGKGKKGIVGKIMTLHYLTISVSVICIAIIAVHILSLSESINSYLQGIIFLKGLVQFSAHTESLYSALGVLILSASLLVWTLTGRAAQKDIRYDKKKSNHHTVYDESLVVFPDEGAVDDGGCIHSAEDLMQEQNYEMAAQEYLRCGKTREAAQMFVRACNYFDAADIYKDAGDLKEAGNCYRKAEKHILAAECYEKAGAPSLAASMYKKGEYYFNGGMLYIRLGQPKNAEDCFNELPDNSEETMSAFETLGDYFAKEKNWSEAIRSYQRIVMDKEVNSYNINTWYKLARVIEVESGKTESGVNFAVDIYEKILSANYLYRDVKERIEKYKLQRKELLLDMNDKGEQEEIVIREKKEQRYQKVKEIGRGGMGVVYQAKDLVLDRPVAYKILLSGGPNRENAVREFKREAKSVATLNHPNIVAIYDFGQEESNYFIVMEYIDGFNLRDLCRENPSFIFPSFKRIFSQIFEGLAYAHSKNIIHRDIKPLNIMINRDGVVKIMDFGLAKFVEEDNAGQSLVKGTPHFISPEQIFGKGVDHRTDIYALGITMYYLLAANRYPFEQGDVLYHNAHTIPPALKEKKPEISERLNNIVMKCLEKKKEKRYQTVDDLKRDIGELPFIIS